MKFMISEGNSSSSIELMTESWLTNGMRCEKKRPFTPWIWAPYRALAQAGMRAFLSC